MMKGKLPAAGQVAHVALRIGRLMLANGAGAERVQEAVIAYAKRFGYDSRLMVTAEGLIITLEDDDGFHTRLGHAPSGMAINMGALSGLKAIRFQPIAAEPDFDAIDRQLDVLEHAGGRYPHFVVILGMGVVTASLARLFGGEWPVVFIAIFGGIVTQFVRQTLNGYGMHPVAGSFGAAFIGGLSGALLMKLFPQTPATLCLVAAGMILVPGAPLINGVRDIFDNHIGIGVSRLALGGITILAITFGLLLAAYFTGDHIPVEGALDLLPAPEDFLFSALAGAGYALLFNVPLRAAWVCVLCGVMGHGLRTVAMHMGLDMAAGALIGAFAAALLARVMATKFDVPPVAFAFPGVVSMIPGAFGFRACIGALTIMKEGANASPALISETLSLSVSTVLVTGAVATGVCLALITRNPSQLVSRTGATK